MSKKKTLLSIRAPFISFVRGGKNAPNITRKLTHKEKEGALIKNGHLM